MFIQDKFATSGDLKIYLSPLITHCVSQIRIRHETECFIQAIKFVYSLKNYRYCLHFCYVKNLL